MKKLVKYVLAGSAVGACLGLLVGCSDTAQLDANLASFNTKVAAANAQLISVNKVLCKNEAGAYQVVQTGAQVLTPIATAAGPQYLAGVGTVQAIDTTMVHPALVAACALVNSLPVGSVLTAAN